MNDRTGFAPADGTKLYYEITGSGVPVVFIHGFSLDLSMWDEQAKALSSSYTVVRYDLRGHGKSAPGNVRYSHAGDLKALLDHLGYDAVTLVGLSLGGSTAVNFAIAYPDRTRALVVIDPSLSGFAWSKDFTGAQQKIRSIVEANGLGTAKKIWLSLPLFRPAMRNPKSAQRLKTIVDNYSGWHWMNSDPGIPTNPPSITRLNEITAPTLVIVGEQDSEDFQGIANTLATGISRAQKIVIQGAGHMVNLEAPEQFNHALLKFLTEIDSAARTETD